MGAARVSVESVQACVSFYLGDVEDALRLTDSAERAIPASAPAALRSTLRANRALFTFSRFLRDTPPPPAGESGLGAWARAVRKAKLARHAEPDLAAYVKALEGLPKSRSYEAAPAPGLSCAGAAALPPTVVPELAALRALRPQFPIRPDSCPAGWTQEFARPEPKAAEERGTRFGVLGCLRDAGGAVQRVVRVHLPARTEGDLPEVDEVLAIFDFAEGAPLTGPPATAFACGGTVLRAGAAVGGDTAFTWSHGQAVPFGVLFESPDGGVWRAAAVEPL